jgi:zinc transporter ZupT
LLSYNVQTIAIPDMTGFSVWALGLGASAATLLGGVLALRLGERIRLAAGLTAGALLGVALFDLTPEAFELGAPHPGGRTVALALGCGFAGYMVLHRLLSEGSAKESPRAGHLGAASLTAHSFLDGLAMGLAFQISPAVGWPVALAVLAHDVSDGINTVGLTLTLAGFRRRRIAIAWLAADALAPVVGIAASGGLRVATQALAPLLGLFAGAFLYLGAAELLPRSYGERPRPSTTGAAIFGLAVIYGAVRLAG